MDARRLQKVFARQRSLRRIEKGDQQGILTLRQRDRDAAGITEAPVAPIELPAAKPATASFRIPLGQSLSSLPPAQHRPDACQKLPQTERLDRKSTRLNS